MEEYNQNNNSKSTVYKKTNLATLGLAVFLLVISLIFGINTLVVGATTGNYRSSDLNEYTDKQFSEIYGDNTSNSEGYVLITFVYFPDQKEYNIKCASKGYLDTSSSMYFDSSYPTFTNRFREIIENNSSGYSTNLCQYLADSVNKLSSSLASMGYKAQYASSKSSTVKYNTYGKFATGRNSLSTALANYHQYTKVNLSIVISSNEEVYKQNWPIFTFSLICFLVFGIIDIIAFKNTFAEKKSLEEKF